MSTHTLSPVVLVVTPSGSAVWGVPFAAVVLSKALSTASPLPAAGIPPIAVLDELVVVPLVVSPPVPVGELPPPPQAKTNGNTTRREIAFRMVFTSKIGEGSLSRR
jgi:hypothetical protein